MIVTLRKAIPVTLILLLSLSACGKKGPVRPLEGQVPDNSVYSNEQPPEDCCSQ